METYQLTDRQWQIIMSALRTYGALVGIPRSKMDQIPAETLRGTSYPDYVDEVEDTFASLNKQGQAHVMANLANNIGET